MRSLWVTGSNLYVDKIQINGNWVLNQSTKLLKNQRYLLVLKQVQVKKLHDDAALFVFELLYFCVMVYFCDFHEIRYNKKIIRICKSDVSGLQNEAGKTIIWIHNW